MSYQRTDYTTKDGKKSAAYYEPLTGDAWDVFTRAPVALVADVGDTFVEWVPPAPVPAVKPSPGRTRAEEKPLLVTLRPRITAWSLVPMLGACVGIVWLYLTHGL